jgi:hypothetical protein
MSALRFDVSIAEAACNNGIPSTHRSSSSSPGAVTLDRQLQVAGIGPILRSLTAWIRRREDGSAMGGMHRTLPGEFGWGVSITHGGVGVP